MKRDKIMAAAAVVYISMIAAAPAYALTYLDHQMAVNRSMCEKKCQAGVSVDDCQVKLNGISRMNPNNAKIEVKADKSNSCISSLSNATCENVMERSVAGPCELGALK